MMETEPLELLINGLRSFHSGERRRSFLREVWFRRQEVKEWLSASDSRFVADALPIFMHGGDSAGKLVIMGVNPGWRPVIDAKMEEFVSASPENYVSFHEDFYRHFRHFEEVLGKSAFWNNLYSKLAALRPDEILPSDKWRAYEGRVVVQDLFPFHSWRKLTRKEDAADGMLRAVARAGIEGLVDSAAEEVWAFSPEAQLVVRRFVDEGRLRLVSDRLLQGCTTTGIHRGVDCLVAEADRPTHPPLRFVAVGNALLSQPAFPFDRVCCRSSECFPRLSMAAQILEACGRASSSRTSSLSTAHVPGRAEARAVPPHDEFAAFVRALGPDVRQLAARSNGAVVYRRNRNFVTILGTRRRLRIDVLTATGWRDGVHVEPGIGHEAAEQLVREAYELAR